MKRKAVSTFRIERSWKSHGWNPTWEPEELQNMCESFKQSLKKSEEHIVAPNLSQPAADEHLNDLQKRVLCHPRGQCVDLRNKFSFDIQPTNPQADIMVTGHCKYWITTIDLWSIKKRVPYPPQMTLCFLKCTLTQ